MHAAANQLLTHLTDDAGPLTPHHTWMLEQVNSHPEWPPDKSLRWLGYVWGHRMGSLAIENWARLSLPHGLGKGEAILMKASQSALQNMPGVDQAPFDAFRGELEKEHPAKLAAGIGVIQALLEQAGLLNVTNERERTRVIFHTAYQHAGYKAPETLGQPGPKHLKPRR